MYLFVRDDVSQPGPHALLGQMDAEGGEGGDDHGVWGVCKVAHLCMVGFVDSRRTASAVP